MRIQPKSGLERTEAQLLFFPPRALLPPRKAGRDGETGTILLFTGVRYERHADDTPALTSGAPASASDSGPAPAGTGRRGPRRRA